MKVYSSKHNIILYCHPTFVYKDIYNHVNCSSNSSDNSNGYSVGRSGRHSSYAIGTNNNLTINNTAKQYFEASPSSSSSSYSSRTFRKNMRPIVNSPNPVSSHVTINNTNVTHHIIHPGRQINYGPDVNRTTNVISNSNLNTNMLNYNGSNQQQNAPGHVRFTSTTTSTASATSTSSSNPTTHPKSILRRKNLNSSSNVVTMSNNNHNNDFMQGCKT